MRIGVDIRCLMDGGRTGVEEYTLSLLNSMLKQNQTDTFVLFANSRKPMLLPKIEAPNVEWRTFSYPNKIFNTALKIFRWPKIDQLIGGVDVLFVPSVRLAPCSVKCPIVVTFHDLSFVRHPEYFSWKRRVWHWFMEPKSLAKNAKKIIAVSKTTANDLEELYKIPNEKIAVVHSGVHRNFRPVDFHSEETKKVKERYSLPEKFILFLGTIEPRKNIDGLISAYEEIRRKGVEQKLVIAGVRGWVKKDFFQRIKTSEFAKDIILTGFVKDEDKPALYSIASLFVYPSFYEGFGFPPLEALLCGTPVITSYNSAIPEIAGQWATLVNPYDPNELAVVILEELKKEKKVLPTVSTEVLEKYNWERAGRETLEVLKEAIHENSK
ncbi:MAG: glycosyltransferase family 1 protein [bacterium]|nr:glycosyltransferase family 1 protein [bacterium]